MVRLGDIGSWSTGGTPSRKNARNFGGRIPWVKSGDLRDGIITATEETLTQEGIASSAAKLLPAGTLSLALYGATIGKLGILGIDAATNQACANCQPNDTIVDRWFVFYYLLAQRRAFTEAGQGGAQPNLTNGIVRDWPLPLPPLAEQKRIVAKVEALLARVNAARERLAKLPAILKRFRQAVLAAACSGRLTADWRELNANCLEPASSLLRQIEESRGAQADNSHSSDGDVELPEKWALTTFGFLAEPTLRGRAFITSGSRGWASYVSDAGPFFIRSENINTDSLRFNDAVRVAAPSGPEADRTRVKPNDLLLTITGNNVGPTAFVPQDCPPAHVSQHVAIIRVTPLVDVRYLWLWLRSEKQGQAQLREFFYGEPSRG